MLAQHYPTLLRWCWLMLALGCSHDHNMSGNVAFYGNTEGSLGLIFSQTLCETTMLSRSSAIMHGARWIQTMENAKCIAIAIAIALCHLENTPRHINKNRELKQWGRERRRQRYKTRDSNPPVLAGNLPFLATISRQDIPYIFYYLRVFHLISSPYICYNCV